MRLDVPEDARQVLAPAQRPVNDEQVAIYRHAVLIEPATRASTAVTTSTSAR